MTPNEVLEDWLCTQTKAPQAWRVACQRLIDSPDMSRTWNRLEIDDATILEIFSMITKSLYLAEHDEHRLPNTQERQSIEDVQKATVKLLEALQGAQLLGVHAPLCQFAGNEAFVAWTDDIPKAMKGPSVLGFPVVSLPDILRTLKLQCASLLDQTPANSVSRQREDADKEKARAFARRLARCFFDRFDGQMVADVTRIVNAVLPLTTPFSDRDVERILRDSPFKMEKAKS